MSRRSRFRQSDALRRVFEAVVSMWGANAEEAEEVFGAGMKQRGIERVEEDEGDKQWLEWAGRKVRWGGLEGNEMCRVMYKLSKLYVIGGV